MSDSAPCERAYILGTQVSLCGRSQLLHAVQDAITHRRRLLVASGNALSYSLAYENPWFRRLLNDADLVHIDGAGVQLALTIYGYRPTERITWADFTYDLAGFAAERGFSLFFLGAAPGRAESAVKRLTERYPNLKVAGTHHGYFDKTPDSAENQAVLEAIAQARPDILIVGFGMPLQEKWLAENLERIEAHAIFTGGAVFDYLSGELRRGPRWMTDHGLEWLARLIIEPRRLWKRYLVGNPLFISRVIRERLGLIHFETPPAPPSQAVEGREGE